MRLRSVLFVCVVAFAAGSPSQSHATLLPGYSAGTGGNTATLVLDFAFTGGDAYLFEYRFDGQATAEDMLLDLNSAGSLDVDFQYFTFTIDGEEVQSLFVNGFTFDGNSSIPVFEGAQGESWSYWLVDNRVAGPSFWTPSATGPTDRVLEDGAFDGWALNISEFNSQGFEPTFDQPRVPTAPPGDLSGDGDIDDEDLGLAFANFTGPDASDSKTSIEGDLSRDGDIDDEDLGLAFSAFTGPVGSVSVPEPASAVLLALAGLALSNRRR